MNLFLRFLPFFIRLLKLDLFKVRSLTTGEIDLCRSVFGNLMAGLIGGHVSQDSLHDLPTLFMRCVIALLIGATVLFLLKKPILKLISDCDEKPKNIEAS